MLKALFGQRCSPPESTFDAADHRTLTPADTDALVDILCGAAVLMPLNAADAKIAASYMAARQYRDREIIIEQGDKAHVDFMLWVLDGAATFEAVTPGSGESVTVTVLGVGGTLGAMSLIDGAARSLQGVASEPTRCAMLTRAQLQKLCREHPAVGVKLMSVICLIVSMTLRDLTGKFKCHVRLNNVLNAELRGRQSERLPL